VKGYSLYMWIRLAFFSVLSKLLYGMNVRVIKGFARVINKGHLQFGSRFTAGVDLRIEVLEDSACVTFGQNVKINDYCHIGAMSRVVVGDDCLIGSRVTIVDHEHGVYRKPSDHPASLPWTPPDERLLQGKPIIIEKNVWIGSGAIIVGGVTIGEGSVIGANAVVTRDISRYSLAVGAPAKVIKTFDEGGKQWLCV
jgi:acetyltransferase-like isoleucine patch superfamily enzyme